VGVSHHRATIHRPGIKLFAEKTVGRFTRYTSGDSPAFAAEGRYGEVSP
jgi:hypothetical protein